MSNSNKEIYNKYMNNYMQERYNKRRQYGIEKLGGKCIKCGNTTDLQFDHIFPETKKYAMAKRLHTINEIEFEKELNKCQLLCNECHVKKSKSEHSVMKSGCKNPNSYITEEQVRKIKSLIRDKLTNKHIAQLMNLKLHIVSNIRCGKTYSSIT